MLPRLRSILLKTPVLVAGGLFLAYLLFGWFGFGPLAKWGAEKFVADRTGHRLSLDEPRFDPLGLQLTVTHLKLATPDGQPLAGFQELHVDFEASSVLRLAWTFDAIRLTGPTGTLDLLPGGKLNWSAFLDAFKDEEKEEDTGLPRLLIRHFELKQGRLDFADRTLTPAFRMDFQPLELSLDDLSTLPDDKGAYQISARTVLGAHLRWKGDVVLKPVRVTGAFALDGIQLDHLAPYLKGRVDIAQPEGVAGMSTDYRVGYDNKTLSLNLDNLGMTLDGLRVRGRTAAEPAIALERLALRGGRFDLGQRTLDLGEVGLEGGQIRLTRRADGRFDVQDWFVAAPTAASAPAPVADMGAKAPAPWRLQLAKVDVKGVGVRYLDQGFARPLSLAVDRLGLGFKADAALGGQVTQAHLAEGQLQLGGISVASAGQSLFTLEAIELSGLQAGLAERHAEIARLALSRGRLVAERGADGRVVLLEAFAPVASVAQAPAAGKPATPGPGWTWRLAEVAVDDFQAALSDASVSPAARLTLTDIDAGLTGLSDQLKTPVPARLSLRVQEGGRLSVQGKLTPARAALDARVNLAGLNLTPIQPYVAQAANVVLTSGAASSAGRLKVGKTVAYQGGFSVADLRVDEAATGNRLLAWQRLASDAVMATPEAVDIGTVKVDGLGLKLVIHADKTLNLKRLMKSQPVPAQAEVAAPPPGPVPKAGAPAQPGMKFAVARVDISANELDFADESLAFPFGTRIHGLKGAINGIGLAQATPAQLELDGQVDDYGLARAVGQIDLLDPTSFTDIKVVFRNVEMNRLTPYSATFAGRRIDSGKLSLDLEYKIKQRALAGDNKIVIDKIRLGERVEHPQAKNLPLDLAIALLEDSHGIIDLGLPVSGSLDDPQFSYGGIIWKAIVNVIGKIVLAPFKALGSLLGIQAEQMEKVNFDLGEAKLLPPEREKLKQLAQALAKRPGLALSATPAWHAEADRQAIKDTRLRRALAEAMGRKLGPEEDPGPVSIAQAKTQEGLEKLFAMRQGADALKSLKAKFAQANPEPPPASTTGKLLARLSGMMKSPPPPLSESESTRLKGANLHELIHQALLDAERVTDAELTILAQARAEAIRRELLAHGVEAARIELKPAELATGALTEVPVKLSLGVARKS
ncbi:MAG: DUF748 domain-containing protein [Pseudomonadota bacterium]